MRPVKPATAWPSKGKGERGKGKSPVRGAFRACAFPLYSLQRRRRDFTGHVVADFIALSMPVKLPHADRYAHAACGVVAAASALGEIDVAGLVVAAEVTAADHAHAHAPVDLGVVVGGVVAILT